MDKDNNNSKRKNIIICCDGTGNEPGSNDTNIVHIVELIKQEQNGKEQVVFYDPGVGTLDLFGKPRKNSIGLWLGKAFGYGLAINIFDAYKFLMRHYKNGDKVYIFGFSRGAFTARKLADLLSEFGLLQDKGYNLIPYLRKLYFKKAPGNEEIKKFKATFCVECHPHFIGVFDTVSSLGYFFGKKFKNKGKLNKHIKSAYHAISIDEKRKHFSPSLWEKSENNKQVIEQVWFAGVHSDIGGWYENRGLSDIALQWILEKAADCGLELIADWKNELNPDYKAEVHDSKTIVWQFLETINIDMWFRSENRKVNTKLGEIHESVWNKIDDSNAGYNPKNIYDNRDQ